MSRPEPVHRAVVLPAGADPATGPDTVILDHRAAQRDELAALRDVPAHLRDAPGETWVHYPWRRATVGLLGREAFRVLRTDRNRNKLTRTEQARLSGLTVGIAGLSVGHAVAHLLAQEGACGALRLADFDALDTSNLNRVPASVLDLGVNKAVVAARRIAELDPFLDVEVLTGGVDAENLTAFVDGLDVLVEECDSLDVKVLLREEARRRGVPVLMGTGDRGLLDVERFDLEPDRALFHGLPGDLDSESLRGLSTADKVPHVLRILGAAELSPRFAATLVEVNRSVSTWPHLAADVMLNAASVAAAVRRLALGPAVGSGRVRIDLDEHLDALTDPVPPAGAPGPGSRSPAVAVAPTPPALPVPRRAIEDAAGEHPATAAVLAAIRAAPSGGNAQPWRVVVDRGGVALYLDRTRTTTMDLAYRGSHVALGAALFNARAAAAAAGALGEVTLFPGDSARPAHPDLVADLRFGARTDARLARAHELVAARLTDRAHGRPEPVGAPTRTALHDAAEAEGARLHLLGPGPDLARAGEAMAGADRLRYLTARLHREMFDELVWPDPSGPTATGPPSGIDVDTLGLDPSDLAKLSVVGRPEVTALLADWDAGAALEEDTRDRVASSSALAVVTVDGAAPADFVRGGAGVEAVWVEAQRRGLAVHPVSPVFLYAVAPADLAELSDRHSARLAALRRAFRAAVGVTEGESLALVLRLSHCSGRPDGVHNLPRSGRRPVEEIHGAP